MVKEKFGKMVVIFPHIENITKSQNIMAKIVDHAYQKSITHL